MRITIDGIGIRVQNNNKIRIAIDDACYELDIRRCEESGALTRVFNIAPGQAYRLSDNSLVVPIKQPHNDLWLLGGAFNHPFKVYEGEPLSSQLVSDMLVRKGAKLQASLPVY